MIDCGGNRGDFTECISRRNIQPEFGQLFGRSTTQISCGCSDMADLRIVNDQPCGNTTFLISVDTIGDRLCTQEYYIIRRQGGARDNDGLGGL